MSTNPFSLPFDGASYDPALDSDRLESQLHAVYQIMRDGHWRTLRDIYWSMRAEHRRVASDAGISARIRDLRKEKFGGHIVERRRVQGGLYEYRLVR